MIYCIFIYALFAFLLLYKSRFVRSEQEADFFKNFNSLRGLFALEIIVGHVVRYEDSLLYPMGKFMIISVAFFFFVSAYGLTRSFHTKEHYLKGFLPAKCIYLLAIALVAFLVRELLLFLAGRFTFPENIFLSFLQQTNWYIWELLLFYVLFYFCYRYLPRYRILTITVITLLFITGCFKTGMIQGYYSSALAFPAGLFFYEYFPAVMRFFKSITGKIAVALLTAAGLSCLLLPETSLIGMVYLRNIMCLAALCLMVYFFMFISTGNIFLQKLGKYSTELYLYQFIFLLLFSDLPDYRIEIPVVCVLTLLTAFIIHPVNSGIKRLLH